MNSEEQSQYTEDAQVAEPAASELDAYLNGDKDAAMKLSAEERALADGLRSLAEESTPQSEFAGRLEQELAEQSARLMAKQGMPGMELREASRRNIFRWTPYHWKKPRDITGVPRLQSAGARRLPYIIASAAVLVLVVMLVLPLLLQHPGGVPVSLQPGSTNTPGMNSAGIYSATPAVADAEASAQLTKATGNTALPTPTATPQVTATFDPNLPALPLLGVISAQAASGENSGIFNDAKWTVNATFPQSPDRAVIDRRHPAEKLTLDNAKSRVAQLGLPNAVFYQMQGENTASVIYWAVGGVDWAWFIDSPDYFSLIHNFPGINLSVGGNLPFDQMAKSAEAFLKERGLLNFPYRIEPVTARTNEVRFLRLLGDYPLLDEDSYNPMIDVSFAPDGQVQSVTYHNYNVEQIGTYPIISAQAAWEQVLSGKLGGRIQYSVYSSTPQPAQRLWNRSYPLGKRVDLYGFPSAQQPVEAGQPPFISVGDNIVIRGDTTALIKATSPGIFFHLWGQLQKDEYGVIVLQLEGWQNLGPQGKFTVNFGGTIRRSGDSATLVAENGKEYLLPDLPADVTDGMKVFVSNAWVVAGNPPTLEWSTISEQPVESPQNPQIGGGSFEPTPSISPTPQPIVSPYHAGDRVDGVVGALSVNIYQRKDGSQYSLYWLWMRPSDACPLGWSASLEGDALKGIDSNFNLDVRVWGTYGEKNGQAVIQVERWEKTYPDEKIQAWLGTESIETVAGRKVIIFTTKDGQKYVLAGSFYFDDTQIENTLVGPRGGQIVVEGVLEPDRIFGGYTVIRDMGEAFMPDLKDLSGYKIQSSQPLQPMPEDQSNPGSLIQGEATVEKIELVYYTPGYQAPDSAPVDDPSRYIQPLWSFSGHLADGRAFEILVQAVADTYLKK